MIFDPEETNFDKIRHYPADALTVDQMEVIVANRDQLNDEEKEAFSYVIEDEDFVQAASEDNEVEQPENPEKKEVEEDEGRPVFKTQAEADAYLKEQAKLILEEEAKKKGVPDKTVDNVPETPKFKVDDPNWKAANAKELYDEMEYKRKTLADLASADEKKRAQETHQRLDDELERLTKEGKIPSRDTPEGETAIKQMAEIAKKYNFDSFEKSYDLWSKIPTEYGGGYDPAKNQATDEAAKKKEQLNRQKAAASRISAGKGEVPSNKPKPLAYNELKSMHLDDITDYALKQYGR